VAESELVEQRVQNPHQPVKASERRGVRQARRADP
jgi:hypothetical protein